MFQGKAVWEGIVEAFELIGHPKAERLYAWAHATDDPAIRAVMFTVLHSHPIKSAEDAVRTVIIQEFRANARSEA